MMLDPAGIPYPFNSIALSSILEFPMAAGFIRRVSFNTAWKKENGKYSNYETGKTDTVLTFM